MNEEERLSTSDIASVGEHATEEQPETEEMREHDRPEGVATEPKAGEGRPASLFGPEDSESFRSRWDEAQGGFVDDPRRAVQQADGLVAEMIKRLADMFSAERTKLEQQWSRGEDVSTEDLRLALRRYRSFFGRLLSI